jgi:hypothetical protein
LQEYVCGDKGVNCSWGHAINVDNRYVFVTQPLRDRVLVISKIQMVVVDVSAFYILSPTCNPLTHSVLCAPPAHFALCQMTHLPRAHKRVQWLEKYYTRTFVNSL